MTEIKTSDPFVQEVFRFLDKLRESGKINMFGAPKVLQDMYGFDGPTARRMWVAWTENFGKDS